MILFVDETESKEYFFVAGLLVESKEKTNLSFKRFKNSIANFHFKPATKAKLYAEFKSHIVDNRYQRIKYKMLEEVKQLGQAIIFSCFIKKSSAFNQNVKEAAYIALLLKIVASIDEGDIEIIFDRFGKADFENEIIRKVSKMKNVVSITPEDSQLEPGLQYIDNICSSIRLHVSGEDNNHYYEKIEHLVKEV